MKKLIIILFVLSACAPSLTPEQQQLKLDKKKQKQEQKHLYKDNKHRVAPFR